VLLLALASLIEPVAAADAILRSQARVSGALLVLGDLADLRGDDAGEIQQLANLPLMPAPPRGTLRFLRVAEIEQLAAAQGVSSRQLRFSGARVVEVRSVPGRSEPSAPVQTLSPEASEQWAASVDTAIESYLEASTGQARWSVRVDRRQQALRELFASTGQLDPAAVPAWQVAGGKSPWLGRQVFYVADSAKGTTVGLVARVTQSHLVVVAQQPIARGALVRASDVSMQPVEGAVPSQALESLEAAIGREARQPIREGAVLLAGQVRAPWCVRRGETVSLRARAAAVVVKTFAVARQDGAIGDLVQVETGTARTKQQILARVTGPRELEVYAVGLAAADVRTNAR
jgi:flagella basal body P-ring formation protein FlgA